MTWDERYTDWDAEVLVDGAEHEEQPPSGEWRRPRKPKRRKRKALWLCVTVLLLAGAVIFLLGGQPVRETEGAGSRKTGACTILIAGTDKAGYRTDTIMLLSLDSLGREAALLSIPRDTYVEGHKSPKINSACGIAGGGAEGMEALMERVREVTGFMPDAYAMVNMDAFVEIVDLMGGVDFNVPVDMKYSDPAQDLYINLSKGQQHLDGDEAIQLVRFRKGYSRADLKRVEVQRDFVRSALDQWLKITNVVKIPGLVRILSSDVITDMSLYNITWVARALLFSGVSSMRTDTLPGAAKTIKGVSYYVPDKPAADGMMSEAYSPYR